MAPAGGELAGDAEGPRMSIASLAVGKLRWSRSGATLECGANLVKKQPFP
jgi:hypothetical protein